MSAPSRLKVFVCPECGEQVERLYDHRGHYCPEKYVEGEGRHFVKAEEVEVISVDSPNVLSVDEAELLTTPYAQLVGGEIGERADLEMRLDDWASKEER